ncbi:MAG TPA: hypothetical protein VEU96_08400 [Bryobacteraceae bacterium]|nr:hypothetical protein [Bryobacteraceae bacterium]
MLRTSLLTLLLTCISALAQPTPEIQARIAAQQNLIRVLLSDLTRYTPDHPQVRQSRALVSVLEEQSRLLQLPVDQWPPHAVQEQIKALMLQVDTLRNRIATYKPSHPDMQRCRAIIDLLEVELQSLQRR